jgi:hypothetical protein
LAVDVLRLRRAEPVSQSLFFRLKMQMRFDDITRAD